MKDIVEFLTARIIDEGHAERQRLADDAGVSLDDPEERAALSSTTLWKMIDVRTSARVLGISLASSLPVFNGVWLQSKAAEYSDHADYDPTWAVE